MSEQNSANHRVVWCDIPLADLEHAMTFYRDVLDQSRPHGLR